MTIRWARTIMTDDCITAETRRLHDSKPVQDELKKIAALTNEKEWNE